MVIYAVVCTHCGSTVLTTAHVDDPELAVLATHLHAEHPAAFGDRRSGFAEIIRHFRLTKA
jgi:hypothetical protein